jgi:hypothetical protein
MMSKANKIIIKRKILINQSNIKKIRAIVRYNSANKINLIVHKVINKTISKKFQLKIMDLLILKLGNSFKF